MIFFMSNSHSMIEISIELIYFKSLTFSIKRDADLNKSIETRLNLYLIDDFGVSGLF
jgi:hypothetical protein